MGVNSEFVELIHLITLFSFSNYVFNSTQISINFPLTRPTHSQKIKDNRFKMKHKTYKEITVFLILILVSVTGVAQTDAKTFSLRSAHLGGQITLPYYYDDLGANGENISPDLQWDNAPAGTQSFAITMYDPATNTGSGWWHWVLFNIPGNVNSLTAGAGSIHPEYLPVGSVSSKNDFGKYGYSGALPIPGSGFHPYIITVYALKNKLGLDKNATPAYVGYTLNANVIAKASIVAYLNVP